LIQHKRALGRPFVFAGERFLDQEGTILRQDQRAKATVRVNQQRKSTGRKINIIFINIILL